MYYWLFLNEDLVAPKSAFWYYTNTSHQLTNEGLGLPDAANTINNKVTPVFILPSARVLFTEVQLPEGIAAEPMTLAYALEERLIADPQQVKVTLLQSLTKNRHWVSVISNDLMDHIEKIAKAQSWTHYEITCDGLLLPYRSQEWSLWFTGEKQLVRLGCYHALSLLKGNEAFVLHWHLSEAIKQNRAPKQLIVYGDGKKLVQETVESWELAIPISFESADARLLLNPLSITSLLPRKASMVARLRQWSFPLLLIGKPIFALVLTWLILMALLMVRQQWQLKQLQAQVDKNFYRVFSTEAVKSVEPVAQMKVAYQRTVGKSEHKKFSTLMGMMADSLVNTPANPPRLITYRQGTLTLNFEKAVNAQAIQSVLPQVSIVGEGKQIVMTQSVSY